MKNYLLLLAVAGAFTFTACNDDDEDVQSKKEMITSKTWKLTTRSQVVTDSTGNSTTDNTIDACEMDDTYKFTSDNNFIRDEGATKCDPTDPQTETGTWALTDNDTKFTITSSGFTVPGDLVEISNSKLVVKSSLEIFGDKIVTTSTFSAQ